MLAKDPANRPASVQAGLEALAQAAQDAGFAVEVASVRRGGMSTPGQLSNPVVTGGDKLTPKEQALMAAAATVADVASQPRLTSTATPSGAAVSANAIEAMAPTQRAPGAGGKGKVVGVAIAGLVVAAAATLLLLRGPDDSDAAVAPVDTTDTPAEVTAEPTATATAVASSTATAEAVPAQVQIIVKSTPAEVLVSLGDEELGKSTDDIFVDQGTEPIELTFTADGYLSGKRTVTPDVKQGLEVRLTPRPRNPVAGPSKTAKPSPTAPGGKVPDELSFDK
jgi:hypothetical protein